MDLARKRHRPLDEPGHRRRWLGWGLVVLGIGLAINSSLGPFVADRIDYPVSETMRNQTIGLDAAALLFVAPITIAVGILTIGGHRAGPVLALGPTSYAAYMLMQYIAGPDHPAYPNVLILQLAMFTGSWLLATRAWHEARRPDRHQPMRQQHGYAALALGAFILLRYVPGLAGSFTNEPLPAEAAGDPAMYWLIVLLDLGVAVPFAVITAIGLLRSRPWAPLLHHGLVGWFTLVTVAVTAMSITMNLNDDQYASVAQLTLFIVVAVMVLTYAAVIYRPLFTPPAITGSTVDEATSVKAAHSIRANEL